MIPERNGWYLVRLEPDDVPYPLYIRADGGVIGWGWDEEDDPELLPDGAEIVAVVDKAGLT